MPDPTVLLVGGGAEVEKLVRGGVSLAFPQASFRRVTDVDEALERPAERGCEVLVFASQSAGEVARAANALDPAGLPRWAVVHVTSDATANGQLVVSALEEMSSPAAAAAIFRSARETHALQRTNARLRGDLLTISRRITHDLRAPLGGIITSAEVLRELAPEDPAGCMALAERVIASADEATKLLERVSYMVRASAAPSAPEKCPMGPIVLVAKERLERKSLELHASITYPTAWPEVDGVKPWLETIWWNLLGNALKHAGPNPLIELGWSEADDKFQFWIEDRGRGVDMGKRFALFTPFHRLHELNSPHGLGLPIVQRLVELQGGTTGYEPVVPNGSRFYFVLPATPGLPVTPEEKARI